MCRIEGWIMRKKKELLADKQTEYKHYLLISNTEYKNYLLESNTDCRTVLTENITYFEAMLCHKQYRL